MELFIILTAQTSTGYALISTTCSWEVTVGPDQNRATLHRWALGQLPAQYREGPVTTLFFSAEPKRFASAGDQS